MPISLRSSPFTRVTTLAAQRPVHEAFSWLHGNPKRLMDWQAELIAIPAPPFGEQARTEWMTTRFDEAGLSPVHADRVGNVFGTLPAPNLAPESTGPVVVLSAHLDTVFPAGTPLQVIVDGDRLEGPGACDNGAGVIGMLAVAHALMAAKVELPCSLLFVGNVGEEGEGDLRGMRHFYNEPALAGRIGAHIVLDGAGADSAVTQALGSKRYRIEVFGPGGHSFTDAGTPNPIAALASALAVLAETALPEEPRTTLNIGTVQGGTSVNSIPESAQASLDFRSTDPEQLVRLEVALHRAVEDAVERSNGEAKGRAKPDSKPSSKPHKDCLSFSIKKIGDRPAGHLPTDCALLETLRAVDRHLGLRTDLRLGSTDANIPLAMGIQALSMGAGGEGGGAHTRAEWYCAKDRETGLKRVVLLALAIAEWAASQ